MTALAPAKSVAMMVLLGIVLAALGAWLLALTIPQEALISTAVSVFLVSTFLSNKLAIEQSIIAYLVVVAGSAWSFALWVSVDDFNMVPALVMTAGVVGCCALLTRTLHTLGAARFDSMQRLLNTNGAPIVLLMLLSWRFGSGVVGSLFALLFVSWFAAHLCNELLVSKQDEQDHAVGRASQMLHSIAGVLWNLLVFWVRFTTPE